MAEGTVAADQLRLFIERIERLEEANAVHDRSIASLDKVTARLEELQAQARGQATRIRMKALREAVEVSKRAQLLSEIEDEAEDGTAPEADIVADAEAAAEAAADAAPGPSSNGSAPTNGNGNGHGHGHH